MSLISAFDFEVSPGVKISKSTNVLAALKQLERTKKFKYDGYDKVFDFGEFIMMMHEITNREDGWRGNTNAKKK